MSRQFYSRADRNARIPRCLRGRSRRSYENISRRDRREIEAMTEFWRKKDARRAGRLPPRRTKETP